MLHRVFYEDILQIRVLAESAQVDKLFEVLECTFPAFGHYNSYLAGNRQQNIQVSLDDLREMKYSVLTNFQTGTFDPE